MQMYDIVATGVLGLLVGFWSGRSIRWKWKKQKRQGKTGKREKIQQPRQLVREGVTIGSPVNGEIRKRMEETAEETADAGTGCISIVPEDGKGLCAHGRKGIETLSHGKPDPIPHGQRTGTAVEYLQRQGRTAQRLLSLQCPAKRDRAQRKTADGI